MFDQLFQRHAAQQRHLNSPLLQERLDYLGYCAGQGYKVSTLRKLANDLLRIQNLLGLASSSKTIDPAAMEAAVKRGIPRRKPLSPCKCCDQVEVLSHARQWLRFMKRLRVPQSLLPVYHPLIQEFDDYLRVQKGHFVEGCRSRCRRVEDFLRWFFRDHASLSQLTIGDLDEAIARKGRDGGYKRKSIQSYAYDLRIFIRYAEGRGWCSRGLAAGIIVPRVYRGENLRRGPSWKDVQRLLATTEGARPLDLRDRALLLLLAVYGLRSVEVRTLKLDDVDWERKLLFVPRTKGRRIEPYPLSPTVGEAIIRYLQTARPRCSYREIFLRLEAPIRPLGHAAIGRVVFRRARSLKPPVFPTGAHALRHACATHLLEQGLWARSLKPAEHSCIHSAAPWAKLSMWAI
jgi:integrase/recombinase XerD